MSSFEQDKVVWQLKSRLYIYLHNALYTNSLKISKLVEVLTEVRSLCTKHSYLVRGGNKRREHYENLLANRFAGNDFCHKADDKTKLRHSAVDLLGVRRPALRTSILGVLDHRTTSFLSGELRRECALITVKSGAGCGASACANRRRAECSRCDDGAGCGEGGANVSVHGEGVVGVVVKTCTSDVGELLVFQ